MIRVFIIPDNEGNIINCAAGGNLVANAELGLYFEVDSWEVVENIHLYRIENRELIKKLK